MLRKVLTFTAPVLAAAFAIVTVASSDAAATTVELDGELVDDPSQNMSGPIESSSPGELPPLGPPPKPPCEAVWTCDWSNFYPSRSACAAACGGPANCAQDFNCDGSCICP